ncbi:MAG TPA: rod shape-determining protein MreC [Hydrogenophaga sp.]|uniref:rod shape-determining protein MreC n=1 Tax=Hydrogenophaga sp. TaxID=1904254 RepID=UPI002BA49CF8|nr:rod shape-determining protein MreC [Hydrogenophaga sp.]HMN91939.1 rod shape-determining protein MreC [Hydrogenophaga sp.]
MPLGTLDRTPPPFFRQGPSALSKLVVFSAVSVFLMVADLRLGLTPPLRAAIATALYPVQWTVMRPIQAAGNVGNYFTSLHRAQQTEAEALRRLAAQADRHLQLEQLEQENRQLRELLLMRDRISSPAMGAQVLYDTADPFSRRIVIDRGQTHGIEAGSPVVDESGVLGQVTRVYPLVSEVTLLIDRDQAIPVLNVRTGVRSVAFGQPSAAGDGLELRHTLASADIEEGDLLTTSGIDGVYPPGLPVARVSRIERRAESSFTRVQCEPLARVQGALHVLVLQPVGAQLPPPPEPEQATGRQRRDRPVPGSPINRSAP